MFAFVCDKQDDDASDRHETETVMRRCTHCGRHAIAGYHCDTCGRDDTTAADQLTGHGLGKCVSGEEQKDG